MSYLLYVAIFRRGGRDLSLAARCADLFFDRSFRVPESGVLGRVVRALGTFGLLCTIAGDTFELLGLGLILAALYLQGRMKREKIWTGQKAHLRG